MEKTKIHVVVFPFPAHGHITPILSLATRLHHFHPDLTITLVCTPRNIDSIRSSLSHSSFLNLHSLSFFPSQYGLPNTESTTDLLPHQFPLFYEATDSLRTPFDDFISKVYDKSQVCIISDIFFGWTVDVAHKYGVFHSIFLGTSAFGGAVYLSVRTNLPHIYTHDDPFTLPEYPEVIVDRSQLPMHILTADGKDFVALFMRRQFASFYKTDLLLVNTIEELEPVGLDMLRKTFKVPVSPIGALIGSPAHSTLNSENDLEILSWLDLKEPGSVLYISFGSQNTINANQMMELALGLEKSGKPFIWVIRPPIGFDMKNGFKDEWLPHGFKERIMKEENRGIFMHGWVPQVEILGHKSIGAFLSHCGWNSVLESLNHGVPIIGWPLGADQPFNVKLLEKLGVCVEVARNNMENSRVEKERVVKVVETVLGENEKGREMRKRAGEIKEIMNNAWKRDDGFAVKELNRFIESVKIGVK